MVTEQCPSSRAFVSCAFFGCWHVPSPFALLSVRRKLLPEGPLPLQALLPQRVLDGAGPQILRPQEFTGLPIPELLWSNPLSLSQRRKGNILALALPIDHFPCSRPLNCCSASLVSVVGPGNEVTVTGITIYWILNVQGICSAHIVPFNSHHTRRLGTITLVTPHFL